MGRRPQPIFRRYRISQDRRACHDVRSPLAIGGDALRHVPLVFWTAQRPSLPSPLTLWAPGGGATGDGGVAKRLPMNWADAVAFPFLMDEPVLRRVGEIFAECFQRTPDDEFGRPKELMSILRA